VSAVGRLTLQAAFETVDELRHVLQELVDWGVHSSQIEVRSSAPIEKPLPLEKKRSWVLLYAFVGALLGGGGAFWLATHSALAYPLPTGGMDIIAGPPIAIVTYEGTALGLILCTVFGVLFEGRLLRPKTPGALEPQARQKKLV